MSMQIRLVLAFFIVVFSQQLHSQEQEASSVGVAEAERPYEVVINGRLTRRNLRSSIVKVQDDLFRRYNELNDDDDFDIKCYRFRPTGSHRIRRVCEGEYMISERADNAGMTLYLLAQPGAQGANSAYLYAARELDTYMRPKHEILVRKLNEHLQQDKEMQEIGDVLHTLNTQLENYGKD